MLMFDSHLMPRPTPETTEAMAAAVMVLFAVLFHEHGDGREKT